MLSHERFSPICSHFYFVFKNYSVAISNTRYMDKAELGYKNKRYDRRFTNYAIIIC